jgi:O-succinylbenzoate synthase
LEVTAVLSMMRQVAGAVDSASIESNHMLTGLARKSTMLSGKTMPLDEAIELHEEPWICPYLARQLLEV